MAIPLCDIPAPPAAVSGSVLQSEKKREEKNRAKKEKNKAKMSYFPDDFHWIAGELRKAMARSENRVGVILETVKSRLQTLELQVKTFEPQGNSNHKLSDFMSASSPTALVEHAASKHVFIWNPEAPSFVPRGQWEPLMRETNQVGKTLETASKVSAPTSLKDVATVSVNLRTDSPTAHRQPSTKTASSGYFTDNLETQLRNEYDDSYATDLYSCLASLRIGQELETSQDNQAFEPFNEDTYTVLHLPLDEWRKQTGLLTLRVHDGYRYVNHDEGVIYTLKLGQADETRQEEEPEDYEDHMLQWMWAET